MSLFNALSEIAKNIKSHRDAMGISEATTTQVSILPFIDALGYDTKNPIEVRFQHPILNWDAVDYAIVREGEPIVVLEAKKASENLSKKYWKQLFEYFNAEDVRFGILTNGIEYRFYTDLKKRNVMDEQPFLTIDMSNLDERLVAELDSFTKVNFNPQHILDGAQKRRIARLLAREIDKPSDDFVKHFAKQVHSGRLTGEDVQRYRQLVREAWRGLVAEARIDPPPPPPPPPGNDIPVYGSYGEHRFEAVMLRTSLANGFNGGSHCIQYSGRLTNGKEAMIAAIRTVDPAFVPGTKQYGLSFWKVIDPDDGTERPLFIMSKHVIVADEAGALRQRVLNQSR